jgi:osmotically-inducible protein OsmY
MAYWRNLHVLTIGASLVVSASAACRQEISAQPASVERHESRTDLPLTPVMAAEPARESDRVIKSALQSAIEQDVALKDQGITFIVDNGDITVTGSVRTEAERQKLNEIALQIDGVKSVANALRVAQEHE